jgi:hypothetical protein
MPSAAAVLRVVQDSPQHRGKPIDWERYARRFGVSGRFVRGTASVSHLWHMLHTGELRESQKLDAADIRKKARKASWHEVYITEEPGGTLLIVDGTHSLHAARLAGAARIPVVVAESGAEKVLGTPAPAARFKEEPTESPVKPLKPLAALRWFRKLIPTIKLPEEVWPRQQYEEAFTMANVMDREVLTQIQQAIADMLESGERISTGPATIADILDRAGVGYGNPQYPEMVFRTAMMNSYNAGSESERMDPDVIETFPVWRYDGVEDGREGEDHRPHFGKYFAAATRFEDVRDSLVVKHGEVVAAGLGGGRPFNCRCVATPIPHWEWAELQAGGVRLSTM